MIVCPQCGFESVESFAACPLCAATRAAPAAAHEERRTVTTLFCDLVDFTALSESADPEDVDAVLKEYAGLARAAIESHGGLVEKYIGDAVVGVFGVPHAHEDDAERAVRAALRLLQQLHEARLSRPDGSTLLARCGVNTGEVLARLDVEPLSGRGIVTGDSVNTAARLQAAAPPMAVAVGELTHALTATDIEYEELPPVTAKGKREPVRAWLARRPVARTGLRTTLSTATPCLEREDALETLTEALHRATSARRLEAVLVVGEPGMGKSRLVLELARRLDEGGGLVTWRQGRCLPYGEGVTFWPLAEILKAHCGILDTDEAAVVEAKLEPVLRRSVDRMWLRQRLRPLLGLEGARSDREQNFAAWAELVEVISSAGPAVLVLEDLHWAGDAMLGFIEHLLGQALRIPVALIVTARPELLSRHHGTLTSGGDRVRLLTLPALSQLATGTLVGGLLEADPASDVVRHVVDLAGGNPLYAEQYARLLLDDGPGSSAPGGPHFARSEVLPVPETVQAVLAARLDTLPPAHKALLCDASVIGEVFWEGGVAELSGLSRGEVATVMAALIERDMVRPAGHSSMKGETEYLFWHALTRDAAYAQLPRRQRAHKHEAIAAWVEETTGEGSADFAEILAHHYETALELARAIGDEQRAASLTGPAVRNLTTAGERALRLDATTAERHLARAIELAGPGSLERLRLLPRLAEALFLTNRLREAVTLLEEAVAGLAAAGDRRAAAVAMCMLAHTLPRLGEPDRRLTRSAVALLADDDPSPEKAEVLAMHALTLAIENEDPEEVLGAADAAIRLHAILGLPTSALALSSLAEARLSLGDPRGLREYERAVSAARAQGLGRERATIELNRGSVLLSFRGPRAAGDAADAVIEFAREHGLQTYATDARGTLVSYLRDAGEWEQTLDVAADLLPALLEREEVANALYVTMSQVYVQSERGDAARVADLLPWFLEAGRDCVGYVKGGVLITAALAFHRLGRPQRSRSLLAECAASPPAVVSNHEFVTSAVRTALALGDPRLAAAFPEVVQSTTGEPRLPLVRHAMLSVEALLAEADGATEAAAEEFAAAAAGWRAFDMPYEEAHALLGRGRCLVALGRVAEAGRALGDAREVFARLMARPALEEAERHLRSL